MTPRPCGVIIVRKSYFSTVTVTGERIRAVTSVPTGNSAALRSPSTTAAVPAPAPVVAPTAAPLAPPRIAPRNAPPTAPPPIFAVLFAGRLAVSINRFSRDRQTRSVSQNACGTGSQAGAFLELTSALDKHHRSKRARSGGNRHLIADAHIADDARFHAIFDARAFAAERRLVLESDDRIGRNDQLFEHLRGRLGSSRRLGRALFNLRGTPVRADDWTMGWWRLSCSARNAKAGCALRAVVGAALDAPVGERVWATLDVRCARSSMAQNWPCDGRRVADDGFGPGWVVPLTPPDDGCDGCGAGFWRVAVSAPAAAATQGAKGGESGSVESMVPSDHRTEGAALDIAASAIPKSLQRGIYQISSTGVAVPFDTICPQNRPQPFKNARQN